MSLSKRVGYGVALVLMAIVAMVTGAGATGEAEWLLSAGQPELVLPVPRAALRSDTAVMIPIHRIEQLGASAVTIAGRLEFSQSVEQQDLQTVPLGSFTVLPPGAPARYLLPGTGLASMKLPGETTQIRLILTLQAIHQSLPPALTVVIGTPQWLQAD